MNSNLLSPFITSFLLEGKTYSLIVNKQNDIMHIKVNDMNNFYEGIIDLNELKKDSLFLIYTSNESLYESLINKVKFNKFKLNIDADGKKNNSCLKLIFTVDDKQIFYNLPIFKIEYGDNDKDLLIQKMNLKLLELEAKVQSLIIKDSNNKFITDSKIVLKEEKPLLDKWLYASGYYSYKLKFLYRMSIDGEKPEKFHSICDHTGATITFVEATNGKRFGGFTGVSIDKSSGYKADSNAFIFSLDNKHKLPIKDDKIGSAIYCHKNVLVHFGDGYDLYISEPSAANVNHSNISTYYNGSGICSSTILAGGKYFIVKEIEVFNVIKN